MLLCYNHQNTYLVNIPHYLSAQFVNEPYKEIYVPL